MEWSVFLGVLTINILLSSDNALAIGMASRRLPLRYRRTAVLWGGMCAVIIQIIITYLTSLLLAIPFLKVAGGAVLAWIALKMTAEEDGAAAEDGNDGGGGLLAAVRLILLANIAMSLDNVLAVAAIAGDNSLVMFAGILAGCPVIMGGSALVAEVLERFPVLVWMGSVFLGWTAGSIIASDAAVQGLLQLVGAAGTGFPAFLALAVSFAAWRTASRKSRDEKAADSRKSQ